MRSQQTVQGSKSSLRPFQRFLLNLGAGLGILCLIMAVLAMVFGIKPLVFVSGSMGPGIPVGALGLAVPASVEEVNVGDVVSVVNSQGERITHRVVETTSEGLVLKGDANPVPDIETYRVEQVDHLFLSVPGLGYVVTWLSQPWAYALGILLCGYLLYIAFWRNASKPYDSNEELPGSQSEEPSEQDAHRGTAGRKKLGNLSRIIGGVAVTVLLGALVLQVPKSETTHAAFTGSATASAAIQANKVQPATGPLGCTESRLLLLTTATVSWPAQQLPSGARLVIRAKTGTSSYGYTNLASGDTSVAYGPGFNLLGLITSGRAQSMEIKLLVVYTTDNKDVTESGSNIGWVSPVADSPARTIVYHPGYLLARDFTCS